ncbi:MAG: hypothetical protein EPO07_19485, partial [Verrucomicrobia bacterium]
MSQRSRVFGLFACTLCGALPVFSQSITDFNPKYGNTNDAILITGNNFNANTTVRFAGVVASRAIADASHIVANVPATAGTGLICVSNPSAPQACSSTLFTKIGPGPYIASFSPGYGASNDVSPINIYGVHFLGVTSVKFGGVSSTSFGVVDASGTNIQASVPFGAVSGPISVTVGSLGPSNSAAAFTVIGPGPYVTGFTPATGNDGQLVTVDGAHFTGVTAVRFNGTNGTGLFVSGDTQLQINAPTGVSTGPISVVSPSGTNTTATNFFAQPVITSFTPSAGREGTNVVLTGRNFTGTTSLQIYNGASFVDVPFTVNANTQLTATIPASALTGTFILGTPAGGFQTASNFVVQPVIASFSPVFGKPGTNVIVLGAAFLGATNVTFNGINSTPSGISYGQLTATVPAAASTGPITVMTTNGSHTSAALFYL